MTCSSLKCISELYEFGDLHQVELKHNVSQQISYTTKQLNEYIETVKEDMEYRYLTEQEREFFINHMKNCHKSQI